MPSSAKLARIKMTLLVRVFSVNSQTPDMKKSCFLAFMPYFSFTASPANSPFARHFFTSFFLILIQKNYTPHFIFLQITINKKTANHFF
jgi:hypothetical protein